ncbi:MAG: hypothetical protein P8130_13815 [Deltaproteobacteria bacterium]
MRLTLFAIFLSIGLLSWPITTVHAEATRTNNEKHSEKVKISKEDRQVIQNMELLKKMEFLKDMELMEGKVKAVGEGKRK